MSTRLTRRKFALGAVSVPLLVATGGAQSALPKMTVHKDPNCGCCGSWVDYLKADGFSVDVVEMDNLNDLKARLGVPRTLQSCHTAEIGGYVIEGHVPAGPIRRLLAERPQAIGLAVAGMPESSPGMDIPGATDTYEVTLFGKAGRKRYARFQGHKELSK